MNMDTMIGHPTDDLLDRVEVQTMGGSANTRRSLRFSGLNNRDIEAETLVRLARGGHDWSGTPRGCEENHHVWSCE
jgi:hypothetical protein